MSQQLTLLGFVGFCKTDIMLYLARMLHVLGEKVAMLDYSGDKELFYSIPSGIFPGEQVDYRGIDVFLNCSGTESNTIPLNDYTVALIDFGLNQNALKEMDALKVLFIVTDGQRHHTVPLAECLSHVPNQPDSIRILRDLPSGKIGSRYLDSILQTGQFTNLIAKYEFPLHDREYSCRLLSQYDDIFQFANIPEDYKNMLMDCVCELFGTDRKLCIKAMKKAQRGG